MSAQHHQPSSSSALPSNDFVREMMPYKPQPADFRKGYYQAKTIPGIFLVFGASFICVYGLWRIAKANQHRSAQQTELLQARVNIIPLLQAEEDRRFIRERKQQVIEEKAVMAGVEGWVLGESPYKTCWMPPTPTGIPRIK